MPHAVPLEVRVPSVEVYVTSVKELLQLARSIKPEHTIDPALRWTDLGQHVVRVLQAEPEGIAKPGAANFAALETAIRSIFYQNLASSTIEHPAFCEIWNLLDIVLLLSDRGWCEPALIFWLLEELLESQTIEGCHRVFDYLDSRRERLKAKHWKSKYLILLRACTELLRRLSRAEDTVFCGRVFIYLFQSFPLGDKSAVNLRGEYHTENVTVFDHNGQPKDRDSQPREPAEASSGNTPAPTQAMDIDAKPDAKPEDDAKTQAPIESSSALNDLYPIFWSLQEYFSKPTGLFEPSNLVAFKAGLDATLKKFKEIQKETDTRGRSQAQDNARVGAKRKWQSAEDDVVSAFNPKYLTSRDLFDLEVSDLAFRRHVLVQGLILTDFLLSQTSKAKARFQNVKNKSVVYDFTLSDEDTAWVSQTRADIAQYLQQGSDGKFYFRMVDTVLSRDKNWVCWKVENCPPFQRPAVAAEEYHQAQNEVQKITNNRRIRPSPMGALDLKFLTEQDGSAALEALKNPQRYAVPELDSFQGPIQDDDFEIQTAKSADDKVVAENARASKLWRALRIASRSKLEVFDKIDDGAKIDVLFAPSVQPADSHVADRKEAPGSDSGTAPAVASARETHLTSEVDEDRGNETALLDAQVERQDPSTDAATGTDVSMDVPAPSTTAVE